MIIPNCSGRKNSLIAALDTVSPIQCSNEGIRPVKERLCHSLWKGEPVNQCELVQYAGGMCLLFWVCLWTFMGWAVDWLCLLPGWYHWKWWYLSMPPPLSSPCPLACTCSGAMHPKVPLCKAKCSLQNPLHNTHSTLVLTFFNQVLDQHLLSWETWYYAEL